MQLSFHKSITILLSLVIQFLHGLVLKEPTVNSYYGLPLLYPYGNCSQEVDTQTLTFYLTHTLPETYKIYANVWQMRTNYYAAPQPTTKQLVENVTIIPMLLTDKEAKEYNQCMSYYCDEASMNNNVTTSVQRVCHEKHQLTGIFVYTFPYDPSILLYAVYREQELVQVLPLVPLVAGVNRTRTYKYYMLYGDSIRKPNFTVDSIAIMPVADQVLTNVSIALTASAHMYRNVHILPSNTSSQFSLEQWDVLWVENAQAEKKKLLLTTITSTEPLAVYTATARANLTSHSSFSYVSTYCHQMPDTSQWGTTFVADLTHIDMISDEGNVVVSLHIVALNDTEVSLITYRYNKLAGVKKFHLKPENLKIVPIIHSRDGTYPTHIALKGSQRLLVLYEAYRSSAQGNVTYFSLVLQPVEWFTFKQSVILATTLEPSSLNYLIALVTDKDHTVEVYSKHTAPVSIKDYENFVEVHSEVILDYTIHRIWVKSGLSLGDNNMLVFTSKDSNGCKSRLGASIFSYSSSSPSYAHSNPPVLDDGITEANSDLCKSKIDTTTTITIASTTTVTSLSVVLLIAATIVAVCLMKPRILFQKPDPPAEDFDYDVFLSFAHQDKESVQEILYCPLNKRGYRVLWHLSDFVAGVTIAENMLTAIKQSRWVIFVCSKHFARSEFCQQELKFGLNSHYNSYKGKYRRIIPLVIHEESCPHTLKQLSPIQFTIKEGHQPKNREIEDLMKQLSFGKPLQVLTEGTQKNRRSLNRSERGETTEDTINLLSATSDSTV